MTRGIFSSINSREGSVLRKTQVNQVSGVLIVPALPRGLGIPKQDPQL